MMKMLFNVAALSVAILFCKQPVMALPVAGVAPVDAVRPLQDSFFSIAILPDVQYYTAVRHGGTVEMFQQQISWIKNNREKENIVYVTQLGDISDHGNKAPVEWKRATKMMYQLETPVPGLPYGIPYGVAVGNHDETPNGNPGETGSYEANFGRSHFLGRSYYGGSYKDLNSNNHHYDLFSANGDDYIVLYLGYNEAGTDHYDAPLEDSVFTWAEAVLKQYANRKAIVVSHSIMAKARGSNSNFVPGEGNNNEPGVFTKQGRSIYDRLKKSPNVFIMLCGHRSGEAFRRETYKGHTIKIYLSDYQSRRDAPYGETDRNGGNGLMRIMQFNKTRQTVSVKTFAPRPDKDIVEEDGDSMFTEPLFR